MVSDRTYTTAEVCELFNISKSTLFRWEREGILPPIPRDLGGQREYGKEHLRKISDKQKEKIHRRLDQIAEKSEPDNQMVLFETLSLNKFLEGNTIGLFELREHDQISAQTQMQLLKIAVDQYRPGDPIFNEIIEIVYKNNPTEVPE